jgi:hypothetical protein
MRDVGAIVWVILVVVGVISSIVSNARKQAATRAPQTAARPAPHLPQVQQRLSRPTQPAVVVASSPVPAPRPQARSVQRSAPEAPAPLEHRAQERRSRRFFGDRSSIVRGVVAAEILGRPLALRDDP